MDRGMDMLMVGWKVDRSRLEKVLDRGGEGGEGSSIVVDSWYLAPKRDSSTTSGATGTVVSHHSTR